MVVFDCLVEYIKSVANCDGERATDIAYAVTDKFDEIIQSYFEDEEDDVDRCIVCDAPLNDFEFVHAADGHLFCSEECGRAYKKNFDEISEEVSTTDIGLVESDNSKVADGFMTAGRCRIAAILCRRDNCTFEEAEDNIRLAVQQMEEVNFDPIESEEIMYDVLGIELDYLYDLLAF